MHLNWCNLHMLQTRMIPYKWLSLRMKIGGHSCCGSSSTSEPNIELDVSRAFASEADFKYFEVENGSPGVRAGISFPLIAFNTRGWELWACLYRMGYVKMYILKGTLIQAVLACCIDHLGYLATTFARSKSSQQPTQTRSLWQRKVTLRYFSLCLPLPSNLNAILTIRTHAACWVSTCMTKTDSPTRSRHVVRHYSWEGFRLSRNRHELKPRLHWYIPQHGQPHAQTLFRSIYYY